MSFTLVQLLYKDREKKKTHKNINLRVSTTLLRGGGSTSLIDLELNIYDILKYKKKNTFSLLKISLVVP